MKKTNKTQEKKKPLSLEGILGTSIQWLWSKFDGVPNFSMRRFTMAANAIMPKHSHPWEHEIYIIEGKGRISTDREECEAEEGDSFYIPQNEAHGYNNPFKEEFIFICVIPNKGDSREHRLYTQEDLQKEGKTACKECIYAGEGHICLIAYSVNLQPEESYHNVNGTILGCEYGSKKNERI